MSQLSIYQLNSDTDLNTNNLKYYTHFLCDATNNNITITLPLSCLANDQKLFCFNRHDENLLNTITIAPSDCLINDKANITIPINSYVQCVYINDSWCAMIIAYTK